MCAYVDLNATQEFLKKNKGKKGIRVYKVLRLKKDFSCYRDTYKLIAPYKYTEYKPGLIISNSKAGIQKKNNREINRGIHTYLRYKDAFYSDIVWHKVIVSLMADIQDLICVGEDGEAVWRKVRLSEEQYRKGIRDGLCYF